MKQYFRLCASTATLLVVAAHTLPGQKTGTSGGTATPATGTAKPTTGPIIAPTPTPAPTVQSIPASPIFVSGSVVTDDGSAIPLNASVQSRCGAEDHAVAYVRSNGSFSFTWGDNAAIFADASESRNASFTAGSTSTESPASTGFAVSNFGVLGSRIGNCELLVRSPGYRSSMLNIYNHSSSDSPEVGTIVMHRIRGDEGQTVSLLSMKAPGNAKKAFQKGMNAMEKARYAEAQKNFEDAVAVYPVYADAWLRLGLAHKQQKALVPAREAFLKALDADAKLVGPAMELGLLAAQDANWKDTAEYLGQAVKLDPLSSAQAWYIDAVANYNLLKLDVAEFAARAAIKMDAKMQVPRAQYLLGMVLSHKENYTGAAQYLNAYLKAVPGAPDRAHVQQELARIEKIGQVTGK